MTDEKHIKRQLNRLEVPSDLAEKIHANWKSQIAQQQRRRYPMRVTIAATLIAVVTLSFLVLRHGAQSPDLISAALTDIVNDSDRQIGIELPLEQVFQIAHILPPPTNMPIEMSKHCNLIGNKTVHLKIIGAKKGFVHLFIKQGDFDAVLWQSPKQLSASMPWRLLKPRKDLSVLVLYSEDMNPGSVDALLQTMFFA